MIFSSNIFIFIFLPVALSLYLLINRLAPSFRFSVLIVISVIFYSYWEWSHTIIIVSSIVINFLLHLHIAKYKSSVVFTSAILFNVAVLIYFKYAYFIATSMFLFTNAWASYLDLALPLGISFFTFQQIAFLSDVKRGITPAQPFTRYALFVTFFPQLVAGPIVHHREMMPQFFASKFAGGPFDNFGVGLGLFIIGLFKKVIIADNLASLVGPVFEAAADGHAPHLILAWTGTLAYTFQLYFDFSAYSDMAMGLALMFGIRLPANFNSPYKAHSIVEFWRRWHMTLSRFLRDYIYIPLGGNRRGGRSRYTNLMVTMLIGGLWHGAGWTFLAWGGVHGLFLIINHLWSSLEDHRRIILPPVIAWTLTFLMITLAWVLFRATSLEAAFTIYKSMFGLGPLAVPLEVKPLLEILGLEALADRLSYFAENNRRDFYTGSIWIGIAALITFFAPNSLQIMRRFEPATNMTALKNDWPETSSPSKTQKLEFRGRRIDGLIAGSVLALIIIVLNTAPAGEFLYFQF